MQERVKEVEFEAKKKQEDLKSKLDQLQKDHEFNMHQKDKEYDKLKKQIAQQEEHRDEYVETLDRLRKRESAHMHKYGKTHNGDPKGEMPPLEVIKSMDLDDIDLITERLCKYGLTFEHNKENKKNAQIARRKHHPRVPKLDLEIVYRMLEKENEYDEYEEEEEEADDDCNSGKLSHNVII